VDPGRPEYLRQQVELSLRHLGLDRIALLQLHRIDPNVPLKAMQDEGKIAHLGLSEVSIDQIEQARAIADIVSVQNRFNFADRAAEDVLDHSTANNIAFIPWNPLAIGMWPPDGSTSQNIADRLGATGRGCGGWW
jgi:pyridoxine 4-dehydrogenase